MTEPAIARTGAIAGSISARSIVPPAVCILDFNAAFRETAIGLGSNRFRSYSTINKTSARVQRPPSLQIAAGTPERA